MPYKNIQKEAIMIILISDKVCFKKNVISHRTRHFIMIKQSIYQEDVTVLMYILMIIDL